MALEGYLDSGNNVGSLSQQVGLIFQMELQQLQRTQGLGLNWRPGTNSQAGGLNSEPLDTHNGLLPPGADNHLPITFNNLYPRESSPKHGAPGPARSDHAMTIEEFPAAAKRVLQKCDTKHDGHITKAELAAALENKQITGPDAQVLAALYQNFDGLQNLSHHKGFFEMPSITAGDIDKFKALPASKYAAADRANELRWWADSQMSRFDTDHNGFISQANIEQALHDPHLSAVDKRVLQYTHDHFEQIKSCGDGKHPGVSKADFNQYIEKKLLNDDQTKMIVSIENTCWSVHSQHQNGENTRSLFADAMHPLDSIRTEAVRQGTIGDCYFESVVASMASSPEGRQKLLNMMHDNGDGTCTVTFPGAPKSPLNWHPNGHGTCTVSCPDAPKESITVKIPTEAELGLYNRSSEYGLWAPTLEKAAGVYASKHWTNLEQIFDNTPQENISHGGWEPWSISLLTGNKAMAYRLHAETPNERNDVASRENVINSLDSALHSHPPKIVTGSIQSHNGKHVSPDGFPTDHAYSIVGFTPGGPGGGQVIIRNPWAVPNDTTSGQVSITLDKFMRNFNLMFVEVPR